MSLVKEEGFAIRNVNGGISARSTEGWSLFKTRRNALKRVRMFNWNAEVIPVTLTIEERKEEKP